MTAAMPSSVPPSSRPTRPFDDLIADRTAGDFVERTWLYDEVERALRADGGGYVLLTGEPGAGKTSLLAGIARAHPEWLRYFVRRDSRAALMGSDVQSFLLSIGHQLAQLRPEIFEPERLAVVVRQHVEAVRAGGRAVGIKIEDLIVSPFHRTAVLEVEQRVNETAGTVIGVEIGTAMLEPRLLEPDNLAHLALIGPAEVLLAEDPQARIVILLDALDEVANRPGAAGLFDWLAGGPELPFNVSVVMTSRPHVALGTLRAVRADRIREIAIDPSSQQVRDDLVSYAEQALGTDGVAEAVTAAGLVLDLFQRDAVHRADGNFLYLSAYAHALNDAISVDDGVLIVRLLSLDQLPPHLNGLYAFFIETARADLVRLGMLENRDPVASADRFAPAWEAAAQPILGLLTVAREPLSIEQLMALGGIRLWPRAVQGVVSRLRWLLDMREDRVAFFHPSVGEYLASEPAIRDHPDWAIDENEWHERIVRHYRGGAPSWAVVDWDAVDRYGLIHIAEHVVSCHAPVADEVADLVCPGLLRAIRSILGGDRYFIRIAEIAADRAITSSQLVTGLPTVFYIAIVRRQLRRSSRRIAPAISGLMARMGQTDAALEHVSALPPSRQRFEAIREVFTNTVMGDGAAPHRELLDLMAEAALTIPENDDRGEALKLAAQDLAAHDLRRALRLWERGHEINPDGDAAPDKVYRAAAVATSEGGEARGLIAHIHTGRASDYLDLAARAEPSKVPDLLRQAELSLTEIDLAERLRGLARLAAAWAPIQPDETRRFVTTILAETDGDEREESAFWLGLVAAAAELARVEHEVAESLLDRIEAVKVDGIVADALLQAAMLWASWESSEKARRLLSRLVSWNSSVWTKVRISAVIHRLDETEARRILDEAHATIPSAPAVRGRISQQSREHDLATVALELGTHDLARATEVAREIDNLQWSLTDTDRYTTLARLAHLYLDAGNAADAALLLEESLRFAEAAPLVDARRIVPFRRVMDAPVADPASQPDGEADVDLQMTFLMNHLQDWHKLRERRLYLDPTEVVHAMSPGPWSIGNPHTWARTLRVFAEAIAEQDLPRAIGVVRSITDRCELAVGLAAMFRVAAAGPDRDLDQRLWEEVKAALDGIEHFEWLLDGQILDQDQDPFAYIRPDHRARFDSAIRLIPYEADRAMDLLTQSGATYLTYAFELSFAAWASSAYASSVSRGEPPFPVFEKLHHSTMAMPPHSEGQDDLLVNIVRARAAANEHLIAAATGQPPAPALPLEIDDPLYAAFVALLATTTGEPVRTFVQRLHDLLDGPRLPAAASLAALAAQKPIGRSLEIRDLCTDIHAATQDCPPATRVVTLLPFAVSPGHTGMVDAAALLAETRTLGKSPWERIEYDEVLAGLFPVLLVRYPADALRVLYDAVEENWDRAMALLEHSAATLVDALGVGTAELLHGTIVRALECTSRDAAAPPAVDGVRFV
jgi:hypothetical protein